MVERVITECSLPKRTNQHHEPLGGVPSGQCNGLSKLYKGTGRVETGWIGWTGLNRTGVDFVYTQSKLGHLQG